MDTPHAHNDIEVNLSPGELVYESADRRSSLPAGVPCAFWGAKPHRLVDAEASSIFAFVTVPLERFMSWSVPDRVKKRLLQGDLLVGPEEADLAIAQAMFDRWSIELTGLHALARQAAALEVEALLCRMSLGTWAHDLPRAESSSIALQRAATMATHIALNSSGRISMAEIAASVHLHPNRAASLFRTVFGVSATEYVRQHRVAEAQRLLLTTEASSASVAHQSGFQSRSAFHDAFREICRVSPTEWRRQHGAAR